MRRRYTTVDLTNKGWYKPVVDRNGSSPGTSRKTTSKRLLWRPREPAIIDLNSPPWPSPSRAAVLAALRPAIPLLLDNIHSTQLEQGTLIP